MRGFRRRRPKLFVPPTVCRRLGSRHRSKLGFFGDLTRFSHSLVFGERVRALRRSPSVVYAKALYGGPERVLVYLAARRIAGPSPISGSSSSPTIKSLSPTRAIAAAVVAASCAWSRTNSSVASFSHALTDGFPLHSSLRLPRHVARPLRE